jgi:predicted AAA+ superfamily ATPase
VFIIEQIRKGLARDQRNVNIYYYRSKNKVEVDLIIEGAKGLIPVEIKSGTSTDKSKLTHLNRFIEEYNSAYGILVNNGDRLVQLSEKVIQVPAIYI